MDINRDLLFGEQNEQEVVDIFIDLWYKIISTDREDILDFKLIDSQDREIWLELKTRRCYKNTYPDTMIWLNKLIEAYRRYDRDWTYTLFLFNFHDWLYYINPFYILPRFDFKKWRQDRGEVDKEKWYIYYETKHLILLNK